MQLNTTVNKIVAVIISIGLMLPNPAYAARELSTGNSPSAWNGLVSALTQPLSLSGIGASLVPASARSEVRIETVAGIREIMARKLTPGSVWTAISEAVLKVVRAFGTNGIRGVGFNVDELRRMTAATALELKAEWEKGHAGEPLPVIGVAVDPRPQGAEGFSQDPTKKMLYARTKAEVLAAFGFKVRFYNEPVGSGHMIATTSPDYPEADRNYAVLMGTASHNEVVDPKSGELQFGLKVFKGNAPIMDDFAARISRHINGDEKSQTPQITEVPRLDFDAAVQAGKVEIVADPAKVEFDRLNGLFDFAALGRQFRQKFPAKRIALNTMNGGMGRLAPMILQAMGFDAGNSRAFNTVFMNDPSMEQTVMGYVAGPGNKQVRFAPDPTRAWFRGGDYEAYMAEDLVNTIAFLIDGDADRLVLEQSGEISPNQIGPMAKFYLVKYLKDQNVNYVDARTVPTTSAMDLLNKALGVAEPKVTDVGSKNFVPFLKDLQIGLEESGHIAFRYRGQVFFDHPVALMLLMLKIMADTGKTWRELESEMWEFIKEKTGAPRIETSRTGIGKDEGAERYYPLLAQLPKDEALREEFGEALAAGFRAQGLNVSSEGFDTRAPGGVQFHLSSYVRVMPRKSGTDGSVRFYFESPEQYVWTLKKIGTPVMKKVLDQFLSRSEARNGVVPTRTDAWKGLVRHLPVIRNRQMSDMFKADPKRAQDFTDTFDLRDPQAPAAGTTPTGVNQIRFDYSKNRVDRKVMGLLFSLAKSTHLRKQIDRMFAGEIVNPDEGRAALHVALRAPAGTLKIADPKIAAEVAEVQKVLAKMENFANRIRNRQLLGATGKPIKNIVNIGIGGSNLGPAMVYEALKSYSDRGLTVRYVSNVDKTHTIEQTRDLNPEETICIIVSKTMLTGETIKDAKTAREWTLNALRPLLPAGTKDQAIVGKHFVAVSTAKEEVAAFGIDAENNMFGFWNWVGGRYSVWSAVGLSDMIAIGPENFREFLNGAHQMDEYYRTTSFEKNIPVILAALDIYYSNFMGVQAQAVWAYDQYLNLFVNHLDQLDRESLGKTVDLDGRPVNYKTGSIIDGGTATDLQHSIGQLFQQGSHLIPTTFIAFMQSLHQGDDHRDLLLANFFAQQEAWMTGLPLEEVLKKRKPGESDAALRGKVFSGNRPTNALMIDRLTPASLGALIALWEQKVHAQSIMLNINAFHQPGVELGKVVASQQTVPAISNGVPVDSTLSSSTQANIGHYRDRRTPRSETRATDELATVQPPVDFAKVIGRVSLVPQSRSEIRGAFTSSFQEPVIFAPEFAFDREMAGLPMIPALAGQNPSVVIVRNRSEARMLADFNAKLPVGVSRILAANNPEQAVNLLRQVMVERVRRGLAKAGAHIRAIVTASSADIVALKNQIGDQGIFIATQGWLMKIADRAGLTVVIQQFAAALTVAKSA